MDLSPASDPLRPPGDLGRWAAAAIVRYRIRPAKAVPGADVVQGPRVGRGSKEERRMRPPILSYRFGNLATSKKPLYKPGFARGGRARAHHPVG
ncbi:hypothetical protein F8B43_1976 [Methylorubrum populi]|uniref:Uncharacterized protein n=1 Tax=Methylorubrum populi TaxID=223967 RepID=A0A833N327_9HYPH|nr:hypothetical protein F8B43_1976 [Methylorubrum populi]